jgi:hypothetical protein
MDDEFLKQYKQTPRAEFARQLQERIEPPMVKQPRTLRQNLTRWSPALIAASILVAAILIFTVPPAQLAAQGFLDLFRVKKFAAVTVDPSRLQQLNNIDLDTQKLISKEVHVIKEPGKPVQVNSPEAAGQRAGFHVAVPSAIPSNAKLEAYVQGEGSAELTADTEKLQSVLDTLGINDVQIPAALNGAKVTVTKPAAVMLEYTLQNGTVNFMQSPSPTVDLPQGVNLQQLGEIGLRVLGLSKDDAHAFAQKVDWSSTFLIPVPANAGEVRQVTVNGADGLMLTSNGTRVKGKSPYARGDSVVLWANNGMVYAMQSNGSAVDLLELANSVK